MGHVPVTDDEGHRRGPSSSTYYATHPTQVACPPSLIAHLPLSPSFPVPVVPVRRLVASPVCGPPLAFSRLVSRASRLSPPLVGVR